MNNIQFYVNKYFSIIINKLFLKSFDTNFIK